MRVPIIWLKDFVNLKISTKNLADKLAMSGLEATSLENGNILDVDILPNRGDCNSIIGVAHEVAAITNSKIKVKKLKLKESAKKASSVLKVEI